MTLPYCYFLCNIQVVRDYKSIAIKFGFKLEKYSLQATNTYILFVIKNWTSRLKLTAVRYETESK